MAWKSSVIQVVVLFGAAAAREELPWYEKIFEFHFPHLYATDLGSGTFHAQMLNTTAEYVLIDFYMPWCSHCQHFAPEYERLAAIIEEFDKRQQSLPSNPSNHLVAGSASPQSTTILAATVDCVANAELCNAWGADKFPTLLWGKREDWVKQRKSMLQKIDVVPRTAETLAEWISNKTHIHLDPSQVSKAEILKFLRKQQTAPQVDESKHIAPAKVDVWDVQLAAAYLIHSSFASHQFPAGQEGGRKAALLNFINLLAKHFPEAADSYLPNAVLTSHGALRRRLHLAKPFPGATLPEYDTTLSDAAFAIAPQHAQQGACRRSLRDLSQMLHRNWVDLGTEVNSTKGKKYLKINSTLVEAKWKLCDTEWDSYGKGWAQCRGTWSDKRGYNCGLWSMFHTLAARTDDKKAMAELQVVRDAIWYFFDCQDCRDHFFQIPLTKGEVNNRREAQLWWWNAHNIVNRRVKKLEAQYGDGDPAYPKTQWPSRGQCPNCRTKHASSGNATTAFFLLQDPVLNAQKATGPPLHPGDVALEKPRRTLAHAVDVEGWDLIAVGEFLDHYYLAEKSVLKESRSNSNSVSASFLLLIIAILLCCTKTFFDF